MKNKVESLGVDEDLDGGFHGDKDLGDALEVGGGGEIGEFLELGFRLRKKGILESSFSC